MTRLLLRYLILCLFIFVLSGVIIFYVNKKISERTVNQFFQWETAIEFSLLNDYLSNYPPNQWQAMINRIRPEDADVVNIVPINHAYLSEKEIKQLKQGQTIYFQVSLRPDDPIYYIYKKTINPAYAYQHIFGFSESEINHKRAGLEEALVFRKLKESPKSKWQQILSSIYKNNAFSTNVTLHDIDDSILSTQDKNALEKDQWIGHWEKYSRFFYIPIPDSHKFIQYGPIKDNFLYQFQPYVIFFTVLIIVELIMIILAILFARSLDKVSVLADAYGKGDFNCTIKLNKGATIYPLFNNLKNMGNRIKALILSHKELTSVISHELRTPLSRLQFSLELLNEAKSEDQRRQRIMDIQEDIHELDGLITEMLTHAQLDRGTVSINLQPVALNKIMNEEIRKLNKDIENIQLAVNLLDVNVMANEKYLLRALSNILQNAKRFTNTIISISVTKINCFNIQISIEDDGPGIPEGQREHVFEPFVQAENQKESLFKTYGLGLAIAKKIIDQHYGEIIIGVSKWGGAKVSIILPLC